MDYIVRRKFLWRGSLLSKGDRITPETSDESRRLNILAQEKMVAPEIDSEFYEKLDAAGVRTGRIIKAKREGTEDE